jgi:hypothetical protein
MNGWSSRIGALGSVSMSVLMSVLMSVVAAGGCDDGISLAPVVDRPRLESCSTTFEEVLALGIRESAPTHLTWDRNVLYYSDAAGVEAVPLDGRPPATVVDALARAFWIEGDDLLFVEKGDQLSRVPLTGGSPTLIVDGQTLETPPAYAYSTNQALDDRFLYWDRQPQINEPWGVWRIPRAGGVPELLAPLPKRDPPYASPLLALTPDSVLEALDRQASAYVVPKQGGEARALARPTAGTATLLGIGPGGVLWSIYKGPPTGDGLDEAAEVRLSTVDGSSQQTTLPFWTNKPPTLAPTVLGSWPDGSGGWVVSSGERFDDQISHQTIWIVDALGNGARVACDPAASGVFVASIALTSKAIYAVVGRASTQSSYLDYSLVRIAR